MKKLLSVSPLKKIAAILALSAFLTACGPESTPTQIQTVQSLTTEVTVTNPPASTETQTPLVRGERTIQFSGYEWIVRDHGSDLSGPGPNLWDGSNVWVDESGDLHLKLTHTEDGWHSAEVTMTQRLGFGRYQFQVIGPIDQLDPNVVLGLFNYPTEEVGPDGTNEIDIEFAHWETPLHPLEISRSGLFRMGSRTLPTRFQLNSTEPTRRSALSGKVNKSSSKACMVIPMTTKMNSQTGCINLINRLLTFPNSPCRSTSTYGCSKVNPPQTKMKLRSLFTTFPSHL
jgi:hypothetical protein